MRTMLRSKVTLLFLAFAVMLAVGGTALALTTDTGGTTTAASPTISSDKDDYAPGELVTLTGSGWQDGESVNIKVNDDAGQTWSRNVDVNADSSGNITDSFNLPGWFVATYSVTATGAQSGVATTSFTDGSIDVRAQAGTTNLAVTFPAGSVDRFNNTGCTGTTPNQTNASAFTTLTDGSYLASTVSANNNQSAKIQAPSPITSGGKTYNFKNLTSATSGVSIDPSTGCISRSSGSNADAWQMTANYVEAPQVTSINRVGASPNNAASVSWTVKFSQSVTGVDASDFALANTGLTGPGSINVTGSGDTYTVTANTGSGDGTLGLNLVDNDTIIAGAGNPLGGTVNGNGSFTGQVFTIDKTAPNVVIDSTTPATINGTGSSTITWHANENGSYSVRVGGTNCSTGTQVASGNYTTQPNTVTTTVNASDLASGPNTVRVCVTDAATNPGSATTTITYNPNSPPSANAGGPYDVNEGGSVQLNGSGSDPDPGDTLTYAWDLDNNGSFETSGQTPNFSAAGIDGPATKTVVLRVTDSKGATATSSATVNVKNVAPTVTLTGDTSANEGTTHTYTYTVSDPGDDSNPTITEECGANGTYTDTATANSFECTFPDGPASSTVKVTANDGDATNNIGSDSKSVTVTNVAPTLNGLTASSDNVLTGATNKVIFTANATDPGDPITYTWSGGDTGSTATGNTYKAGFSTCGDKTVTVTISDGDGGTAQMTKTVKAWNAMFQAPIKDGSVNTAAKGQVVPVKATIGCGTTNLTTLQPVIQLLNGDATPEADSGTTAITTSVSSADTGQFMRPVDAGYIYNLQAPSAAAGTKYTIRVNPWGPAPTGTTAADWNLATGMYALLQIRK